MKQARPIVAELHLAALGLGYDAGQVGWIGDDCTALGVRHKAAPSQYLAQARFTDLAHLVGIKLSATQLNLVTTDMRARILSDRTISLEMTDPGYETESLYRLFAPHSGHLAIETLA